MTNQYDFKLTPAYCLYNGAAVLSQEGACIQFLMENPDDKILKGRLQRAFMNHLWGVLKLNDCPEVFRRIPQIEYVHGTRTQLRNCVSRMYKAEEKSVRENAENEILKSKKEAAAVLLLDSVLNEARVRNATDIHIEKNCVRLRVNGQLEKLMEIQEEKSLELVQRIKLLSGMNVIEKRRCQDGHFVYGSRDPVFIRASTMSVVGNKYEGEESIVMRILDSKRIPLCIDELGFSLNQLDVLYDFTKVKNGLVLVCGPTGSGKSTTVASLLVEIGKADSGALKIISLEDPPEYVIPNVTQVKVDERNSFSDALNHIFRQDPDVIMIGEIRDEQSAAAALRASLTGHLVFATLHASSAAGAVLRLENLGLERKLLCSVLRGVVCQELNYIGNEIKLYADVALPSKKFASEVKELMSEDEIETLMQHENNYSEILTATIKNLSENAKEKSDEKTNKRKTHRVPYVRRKQNAKNVHRSFV